jgi:hypothetical protein
MKRFLLFAGQTYYASGGFHDFVKSYDSREEACEVALSSNRSWWHVYDAQETRICAWGDGLPYGAPAKPEIEEP